LECSIHIVNREHEVNEAGGGNHLIAHEMIAEIPLLI
jgi:hypothetical protein